MDFVVSFYSFVLDRYIPLAAYTCRDDANEMMSDLKTLVPDRYFRVETRWAN